MRERKAARVEVGGERERQREGMEGSLSSSSPRRERKEVKGWMNGVFNIGYS